MAHMTYSARPFAPGRPAMGLQSGFFNALADAFARLREVYEAERRERRLAYATRDLDQHLLRDIGLDHSAS